MSTANASTKSCLQGQPLGFRIGEISVSLRSDLREPLTDFTAMYHGFRETHVAALGEPIRMEVRTAGRSLRGGRWYAILGDGEEIRRVRRREEIVPYLEWGINWRVIERYPEYLQLHAASLARHGHGVVFAASSGAGKSTLAAALVARGWKYLSDEFALIAPDTLQLHPFPKALCIKAGSFDVIERLNLPICRHRYYIKAFKGRVCYICPHDMAPQPVANPSPIRCVILPRYVEGAEPRLYRLPRAQAVFALSGLVMNRAAVGAATMSILLDVVRGAECFGLEAGGIGATCDLVESRLSDLLS